MRFILSLKSILPSVICKPLVILSILAALNSPVSKAHHVTPSPDAQVNLLTASPGNELYTLFGHTALWIYDPETGLDRTYNYGTFDFDTDGFYWKFAMGNLRYFLSTAPFETAKQAYLADGRTVTEQHLNLTPEQTKRLYHYLQINAKPENRYYSYEFFYDNCTTRIYDTLKAVTGDSLRYQKPLNPAKKSFRQFINPYLKPVPWVKFGINLLLGAPADRLPSGPETLFLPDMLKESFTDARMQRAGTSLSLVAGQTIYAPKNQALIKTAPITPDFVFWLLLGVSLLVSFFYRGKREFWQCFDRILFGSTGLVGLVLLFLWVVSSYPSTNWNWNILWTAPALPGFIQSLKTNGPLPEINKEYWIIFAAILLLFLLSWPLIPQQLPKAIIPILLLLGYRCVMRARLWHWTKG